MADTETTQFRIWANKILKEYLIKGYAINENAKSDQLDELIAAYSSSILETVN